LSDIRRHSWYSQVSQTEIPQEGLSLPENEAIKKLTMKSMTDSGADMNLVLDNVATKACNSLTATYYLFQQKHRNQTINDKKNTETQANALSETCSVVSGASSLPDTNSVVITVKPIEPSTEKPSHSRVRGVNVSMKSKSIGISQSPINNTSQTKSPINGINNITNKAQVNLSTSIYIDNSSNNNSTQVTPKSVKPLGMSSKQTDRDINNNIANAVSEVSPSPLVDVTQVNKSNNNNTNLSILRHQHMQYSELLQQQVIGKLVNQRIIDQPSISVDNPTTIPPTIDDPSIAIPVINSDTTVVASITNNNQINNQLKPLPLIHIQSNNERREEKLPIISRPAYSTLKEIKPVSNIPKLNLTTINAPDAGNLLVSKTSRPISNTTQPHEPSLESQSARPTPPTYIKSIHINTELENGPLEKNEVDMQSMNNSESDRPSTRRSRLRGSLPNDLDPLVEDKQKVLPGLGDIPSNPIREFIADNNEPIIIKAAQASRQNNLVPSEPSSKPNAPVVRRGRYLTAPGNDTLNELVNLVIENKDTCQTKLNMLEGQVEQPSLNEENNNVPSILETSSEALTGIDKAVPSSLQ
jgi:hypothetical protein